jgi:hypothetical protein
MYVASMMLCQPPKRMHGRLMLSCSDAVWEPVHEIPDELKALLTDELGNPCPDYGGFLFTRDPAAMLKIEAAHLLACFRVVHQDALSQVDCPLAVNLSDFEIPLVLMGWDIATGNGWVSASFEGVYPIGPFDGSALTPDAMRINSYGLFTHKHDAIQAWTTRRCQVERHGFPSRSTLIAVQRPDWLHRSLVEKIHGIAGIGASRKLANTWIAPFLDSFLFREVSMNPDDLELHDAQIVSFGVDIERRTAVFVVNAYESQTSKSRTAMRISFSDVTNISGTADLLNLGVNACSGNVNYWKPATAGGPTFIYLNEGCFAIDSHGLAIEMI